MIRSLDAAVAAECGGKAGTLGALRRAGFRVPDGFVVPFAYRSVHRDDTEEADAGTPASGPALPAPLQESIARHLRGMDGRHVAVRSSASDEDRADTSAAGQYATVLAAHDAASVLAAVRACWASLDTQQARAYRSGVAGDRPARPAVMAVLIQRLVDAEVSGVMFASSRGRDARIESAWGLGTSVVNGTVDPDRYEVSSDGRVTRTVGNKRTRDDRVGGTVRTQQVRQSLQHAPTLDDATARTLAQLAQDITALLGAPQDIEWAIDETGIWILQARPITAEPPPQAPPTVPDSLRGTPGSRGVAFGRARIVTGSADFGRVERGDILVCPHTDPSWTPLLRIAGGVITEVGGALSHAAIVAREHGIPAVLGIPHATTRIPESAPLTIDGTHGTVTVPPDPHEK